MIEEEEEEEAEKRKMIGFWSVYLSTYHAFSLSEKRARTTARTSPCGPVSLLLENRSFPLSISLGRSKLVRKLKLVGRCSTAWSENISKDDIRNWRDRDRGSKFQYYYADALC